MVIWLVDWVNLSVRWASMWKILLTIQAWKIVESKGLCKIQNTFLDAAMPQENRAKASCSDYSCINWQEHKLYACYICPIILHCLVSYFSNKTTPQLCKHHNKIPNTTTSTTQPTTPPLQCHHHHNTDNTTMKTLSKPPQHSHHHHNNNVTTTWVWPPSPPQHECDHHHPQNISVTTITPTTWVWPPSSLQH